MKRTLVVLFSFTLVTLATAAEVQLNGHTFTIPDGFEIQLVGSARW